MLLGGSDEQLITARNNQISIYLISILEQPVTEKLEEGIQPMNLDETIRNIKEKLQKFGCYIFDHRPVKVTMQNTKSTMKLHRQRFYKQEAAN